MVFCINLSSSRFEFIDRLFNGECHINPVRRVKACLSPDCWQAGQTGLLTGFITGIKKTGAFNTQFYVWLAEEFLQNELAPWSWQFPAL
jgi:hypothetical protein